MYEFSDVTRVLCDNDKKEAIEILTDFSEQLNLQLYKIEIMLSENNIGMQRVAANELHKIVGASGLLGLVRLSDKLREFENELKYSQFVKCDFMYRLVQIKASFVKALKEYEDS